MPTIHEKLIAAGIPVKGTAEEGKTILYTEPLTKEQEDIVESILVPERYQARTAVKDAEEVSDFGRDVTKQQFITWCDNNLLSASEVDAATLAQLKENVKALNRMVKASGLLIIALRNFTQIFRKG